MPAGLTAATLPSTASSPLTPLFPMYVLPVADILALSSLPSHEQIKPKLVEYDYSSSSSSSSCAFVSHTWLRRDCPDSLVNDKLALLQTTLKRAVAGKLAVETDLQVYLTSGSLAIKAKEMRKIQYVWMDWFSIPQAAEAIAERSSAIASIAAYITHSAFFLCLAGAWKHEDGSVRDVRAWTRRGWCRLESLANALSPQAKRLIIVESATSVKACSSSGPFWAPIYVESVGRGAFTVADDAYKIGPIIAQLITTRKAAALAAGDLLTFRILHALTARLLDGTATTTTADDANGPQGPEAAGEETYDEWMATMRFESALAESTSGWTPLRFAVMASRLDIASRLLADGASVEAPLRRGYPQHWLTAKQTIFAHACQLRVPRSMAQLLLSHGAQPDAFYPQTMLSMNQMSSLFFACFGGAVEIVDLLMSEHPQVFGQVNGLGEYPVLGAGYSGHEETVRHLLTKYSAHMGPILNITDGVGSTLLGFATTYSAAGDVGCIRAFLEAGVDPNLAGQATNKAWKRMCAALRAVFWLRGLPPVKFLEMGIVQQYTPLHGASHSGNLGACDALLEYGADVNSTAGVRRMTPLAFAAMWAHEPVVERLLAAGADPSARDAYGRTPADWARKRGHAELARRLKAGGKGGRGQHESGHAPSPMARGASKYKVAPAP